ncbi:ABC transporter permease subunit [Mycoplasmopsis bovis]|uniref:ABC transporter permease subunit n=1 Tax=Mycoplasmopsis bovis TaxID=28903 RepID=UPI003CFC8E9F
MDNKDNLLLNKESKNSFVLSKHKKEIAKIINYKSGFQLFWSRFFSKKINYFWLAIFISFILMIICISSIAFLLNYSPYKPVLDSDLSANLPNYYSPVVSRKFFTDSPILKIIRENNELHSGIIKSSLNVNDYVILDYDPYALIKSLSGKNYYFLFGTNTLKIDRFSFFVYSFLVTIALSLTAIFLQYLLGTFLGSIIGFYSNKMSSKISYYIFSSINIFPFLIINIIFFKILGYSFVNAVVILSIFGSISFFYIAYANTLYLKNKEFIFAYRSFGASSSWILMHIVFVENLWLNITLISDNLSLNMLVLAALSFFNIKNVEESLNIGNVFKDLVTDLTNISYTIFVVLITSLFIIVNKIFSIIMYRTSRVRE